MPTVLQTEDKAAAPGPSAEHHDYAVTVSDFASIASVGLTLVAAIGLSPEIMALAAAGAALAAGSKLYSSRRARSPK